MKEKERERAGQEEAVSVQQEQMKASPVTRPATPFQLTVDANSRDAACTVAAVMDEVTHS